MATLSELKQAVGDGQMLNLVEQAKIVKAAAILEEASPSQARLDNARNALENPGNRDMFLWRFLVGKFKDQSLDALLRSVGDPETPSDATIQAEVDIAIDKLWV